MGIISDTLEDNRERKGQILSAVWIPQERTLPPRLPPPVWHSCPACGSLFQDQQALAQHLHRICRSRHLYVRMNDQIVRDFAWAPHGIASLELVQLGNVDAEAEIRTLGARDLLRVKGTVPLMKYVPEGYDGIVDIRVSGGYSRGVAFRIYSGSAPSFSRHDLEERLAGLLRVCMESGQDPDLTEWRRTTSVDAGDFLGERFVNGVFEYGLGMRLEMRGNRLSKEHLESAFGALLPFEVPLAVSLQSVLALKMNCFEMLSRRDAASPFAAAARIFNGEGPAPEKAPSTLRLDVPADQPTELILRACRQLLEGRLDDVQAALGAIEQVQPGLSRTDSDKVTFIRARLHTALAVAAYEEIQHHPVLGTEASRWLALNRLED